MSFDDLFNIDNSYMIVDQSGNQYTIRMIDLVDPENPLYVVPTQLAADVDDFDLGFWVSKDELRNYNLTNIGEKNES